MFRDASPPLRRARIPRRDFLVQLNCPIPVAILQSTGLSHEISQGQAAFAITRNLHGSLKKIDPEGKRSIRNDIVPPT